MFWQFQVAKGAEIQLAIASTNADTAFVDYPLALDYPRPITTDIFDSPNALTVHTMTLARRSSGVVLHITSLPGEHGVGDLGQPARLFVDWLARARQSVWQMLPINPIGPGHSPYQSPSAFACSGLMVALQPLVDQGWLPATALTALPDFNRARVDYDKVIPWRWALLRQAANGFAQRAHASQREA